MIHYPDNDKYHTKCPKKITLQGSCSSLLKVFFLWTLGMGHGLNRHHHVKVCHLGPRGTVLECQHMSDVLGLHYILTEVSVWG